MQTKHKVALWALVVAVLMVSLALLWLRWSRASQGEEIGTVATAFHLTGSDGIAVEAYDDPLVEGVTCYVSRARTGGLAGQVGMAEDKTETGIACGLRPGQPARVTGPLPLQADLFTEKMSAVFKTLHVVRMVDVKRHALVYLPYSDKVVDGSPKHSLASVFLDPDTPLPIR